MINDSVILIKRSKLFTPFILIMRLENCFYLPLGSILNNRKHSHKRDSTIKYCTKFQETKSLWRQFLPRFLLGENYSVFARSPLSLPQSLFSRSLRSTICNPGHPHPMGTLRITNEGPERAKKQSLGEREGRLCNHRIHLNTIA